MTPPDTDDKQPSARVLARQRRVFELHALGYPIPYISNKLKDEGFRVGTSERTVWEDLHSHYVEQLTEELIRRQLMDIALAENDFKTRLHYRDRLLDKLVPKKIESKSKVSGTAEIVIKGWRLGESDTDDTG